MKTLRAIAAALLIASGAGAAPASARPMEPGANIQLGGAGAAKAAPGFPRHYRSHRGSNGFVGGPGWLRNDRRWRSDRPDKPCKRRNCRDRGWYGFGYGGIGYDPLIAGGAYGYFEQDTDEPEMVNGRPRYDYDRGYPYEYYGQGPRAHRGEGPGNRYARMRDCTNETTRDRRTGRDVQVRVCRN